MNQRERQTDPINDVASNGALRLALQKCEPARLVLLLGLLVATLVLASLRYLAGGEETQRVGPRILRLDGVGSRYCLYVHHTDADREWAYDRQSSIGRLDKGPDEAQAKGWTVVDMKQDWKRVFPFDRAAAPPSENK